MRGVCSLESERRCSGVCRSFGASRASCCSLTPSVAISANLSARDSRTRTATALSVRLRPRSMVNAQLRHPAARSARCAFRAIHSRRHEYQIHAHCPWNRGAALSRIPGSTPRGPARFGKLHSGTRAVHKAQMPREPPSGSSTPS